jgi:hypothetical protein
MLQVVRWRVSLQLEVGLPSSAVTAMIVTSLMVQSTTIELPSSTLSWMFVLKCHLGQQGCSWLL